jgi:uncharacterized protein YcbK (DUF882 family)
VIPVPGRLAAALAAALLCSTPALCHAQTDETERVYVVRAGDTISRIAARLGVSPRALAARNYLTPPYRLRIGRRLRLPDGVDPNVARRLPTRAQLAAGNNTTTVSPGENAHASHRAGFVTLVRARDGAVLATNFTTGTRSLRMRVERFLRFRDGSRHLIHPRLLRHLAALSDHFGGRRIVVLSGFRPHLRDSVLPRGTHSRGYAVDLRVEDASLAAVHAFCTTLRGAGCGLYPRANFVHLDVRAEAAAWTDGSGPGDRRARRRGAEESVAEVMDDAAPRN